MNGPAWAVAVVAAAAVPEIAVEHQHAAGAADDDFLVAMSGERLGEIPGEWAREAMGTWNDTGRAVLRREVIEHPERGDEEALIFRIAQAIGVQSLLTEAGQRIATMQDAEAIRLREPMLGRGCQYRMMGQRAPGLRFRRFIGDLDVLRAARWRRCGIEGPPKTLDPGVVERVRNEGVAVAFERLVDRARGDYRRWVIPAVHRSD